MSEGEAGGGAIFLCKKGEVGSAEDGRTHKHTHRPSPLAPTTPTPLQRQGLGPLVSGRHPRQPPPPPSKRTPPPIKTSTDRDALPPPPPPAAGRRPPPRRRPVAVADRPHAHHRGLGGGQRRRVQRPDRASARRGRPARHDRGAGRGQGRRHRQRAQQYERAHGGQLGDVAGEGSCCWFFWTVGVPTALPHPAPSHPVLRNPSSCCSSAGSPTPTGTPTWPPSGGCSRRTRSPRRR